MALRVWLPLNGTLENKGISGVTVTNNGATVNNNGKIGKCYYFDNTYTSINNVDYSSFGTSFSVAFWYKIDTAYTNNRHLVCLCNQIGWAQLRFTCAATSTSTLSFNIGNGNNSNRALTTPQVIGSWQHIVFTFDNKVATVYVNGILAGTATYSINPSWSGITKIGLGGGPDGNERSTTLYLNDVRVYDHCLSSREVKEISQGLVLHYKLDEFENGYIPDSSGYDRNGTVVGTITEDSNTPRYLNSINFPSASCYIKLPEITYSNFGSSYTFTWWEYITTVASSPMPWGFSNGNRLNLFHYSSLCWNTGDTANNPFQPVKTNSSLVDETWHFMAIVGDGTSTKLYIDNEEVRTAKTWKPLTGTQIYISGWDTGTNYTMTGNNMSDFRIYATALSEKDILDLYHTPASIDNLGSVHAFELVEDNTTLSIKENGQFNIQEINEYLIEPDGSIWEHIFHHDNPTEYKFSSTDTFATGVYTDSHRWFNIHRCNELTSWEFLMIQSPTAAGTYKKWRFSQTKNPMTAAFADVDYADVTYTTGDGYETPSTTWGGLYYKNNNCYICQNNASSGNWWGATGTWTAFNGGIPGWHNVTVTTGTQDLYVRITDTQKIAKLYKNGNLLSTSSFIEK